MSSSLTVHQVDDGSDLTEFIRFPLRLYRDSRYYVPHLEIERRSFFNPSKNPFYSHAEVALFLVRSGRGETLGRISAHIDRHFNDLHGTRTGHFGFFDCIDDHETAAALLGAAEDWLRRRGMTSLEGPLNFTTNDEVGTLVKGFDGFPFLMMTFNEPYYGSLLEGCSLAKTKDLFAYYITYSGATPQFVRKLGDRTRKSNRISIRTLEMKKFKEDLALVKRIYNDAWEKNWGFVPLTDEQIDHLAGDLKPLVNPELVYFAFVDGEPAGFFMALPDYNVLFRKMKGKLFPFGILRLLLGRRSINRLRVLTMGVAKKFRHLGIEMVMIDEIYRRGPKNGFASGELSWILEDNDVMNRIARRLCGEPYRVYRVYRKDL
jgi:GNAT superfamily N-acetyltransferase